MDQRGPAIELRGIGKSFGPVHALTNVNLDIPAGQVTALVGDNGAGKTTLIKCIAGIWEPSGGEIRFDPAFESAAEAPPRRQRRTVPAR